MCGINGGYKVAYTTVQNMVQATHHRGPDSTAIMDHEPVVFGHNRLAIIDITTQSNQPMRSPDGRHILVFNGEIYNFKQLKKQLTNWDFVSAGDSEVLLAALATWGEQALDKIEGIFAFAWYDTKLDSLLLAKDPCGVKPLYYHQTKDGLIFSSELQGILAAGVQPKLNHQALSAFLHYNYVPSPATLITDVYKLRPGHLLRFTSGSAKVERYYTPGKPSNKTVSSREIRTVIKNEVTEQLVSDRPLGVLLSGGLDSSIVLHHAAQDRAIKTFSTGFELSQQVSFEHDRFNADAKLAKQTAKTYGCEHHELTISLGMIKDELVSSIEQLDEPIASPTQVSQLLLNRFIRQHDVVVGLGGDGGDELWGGYSRHAAVMAAQYFQTIPKSLQTIAAALHTKGQKLQQPMGESIHWGLLAQPQDAVARVLKRPLERSLDRQLLALRYREESVHDLKPIEAFMQVDREMWLADDALARTDRSAMVSGVEVRVPLLGLSVVELADSIHAHKKFNIMTNKKIIRTAYKDVLPDHLFTQPKRGWMAPGTQWLYDAHIKSLVDDILSDQYYTGLSQLIDWAEVRQLLLEHVEQHQYHLNPVWNLLVLQIWAKKFSVQV